MYKQIAESSTSSWVGPFEFTTNPGCGDTLFDSGGATGNYANNDFTTVTVYPDNTGILSRLPSLVLKLKLTMISIRFMMDQMLRQ